MSSSLGHVEHHREQHLLHDRAQAAGAGAAQDRLVGDRLERVLGELELDAVELEQPLVLLDQRVARLGQDLRPARPGRGCVTVVMTGSRPMNSGIRPNFSRSSGMTSP